ncbi:hypothetical protein MKEN_00103700 [Mycena kentingensis (nom. inval.)]|nr:hypothetical protein MKEN_00103700 [Mycena kentingensis (nom. inval.)]
MATLLTDLIKGLTPPPVHIPAQYDGLEYRWKFLTFRPALFKTEIYLLSAVLFYGTRVLLLRTLSQLPESQQMARRARTHLRGPVQQTYQHRWIRDGYTDFFNFSTGRRNVASLHTIFALRPRHDLFQWIWQHARTSMDVHRRYKDDLQLDFKLLPGTLAHDFVWGIVHKDELRVYEEGRWDLSWVKKVSENPNLPSDYMVMSELADVTDGVFKAFPVGKMLEDPKIAPYFRSLSITDQPREFPEKPLAANEREKHVILSLSVPSPSQAETTADIVDAVFQFVDALPKINIRPESKSKLVKRREEIDASLKREYERDKKEEELEALEAKKAAKRKAAEDRIAKLSAAEQQKILDRERKRSLRKQQVKVRK